MKINLSIKPENNVARIAFSKQEQALTCLSIILQHYDYSVSSSEIRDGRLLDNCQFSNLKKLAAELGYNLVDKKFNIESIETKKDFQAILNLNSEGPVVINKKKDTIWINNPYSGIRKIDRDILATIIKDTDVLTIDVNSINRTLKRRKPSMMWSLLLSEKSLYIVGAVIVLISVIHGVVLLIDPIVKNVYFSNVVQMGITDWAKPLAILYFVVAVIGGLLLLGGSALSLLLTSRLALKWSFNTFTSLLRVPLNYLDLRTTGDLMNRVRASERLGSFIGSDEIMLVGSLINLILLIFVLLSTSIPLALLMILFQVGGIVYVTKTNNGWKARADDLQQQSAFETGSFVNLLGNVKLLREEDRVHDAFRIHQFTVNRRIRSQQKMSIYSMLVNFGSSTIDTFQSVVLLTIAALLIMTGEITLGEYVAFSAILGSVLAPIKKVSSFISKYQSLRATHERILDIIEESSLQDRYGIKKGNQSKLLELTINSKILSSLQSTGSLTNLSIDIMSECSIIGLAYKSDSQSELFESLISGDQIISENINLSLIHKDGSRDFLVASSKPYIFSGSILENIKLGINSSPLVKKTSLAKILELMGWDEEFVMIDCKSLEGDAKSMQLLGIARALWRSSTGVLLTIPSDMNNKDDILQLLSMIKDLAKMSSTSFIVMIQKASETIYPWDNYYDISTLMDIVESEQLSWRIR